MKDPQLAGLVERTREEWEALGLMSYHGSNGGVWFADLTEDDVRQLRDLIRDLAHKLDEIAYVARLYRASGTNPHFDALYDRALFDRVTVGGRSFVKVPDDLARDIPAEAAAFHRVLLDDPDDPDLPDIRTPGDDFGS